ncbi:MAG: TraR/DksA family transcriptional regulator [Parachlamydiales bacterium]|nr:TraR/DksA family transcriptional regulator [Parachlamydiales bacterium]
MTFKKAEIEKFRKQLEEMYQQLCASVHDTTEGVKELSESRGYSQHQADEGTDDFDKTISLELTNKEMNILKQIKRALEKMEEGTYGICDVTGEPIPKARLEAIPYATMTVDAQEKFEKGLI